MLITSQVIKDLFVAFKAAFVKGLGMAPTAWQQIATKIDSKTAQNTYGFLGQFPKLREWIGPRVINDMAAHGYFIKNKDFEGTVGVLRTDIEDDNIGIYNPLMEEMGRAAAAHPDEIVFSALKKGDTLLCYDGQPFFDADHPVYANVDGTGAVTTVANIYPGAGAAWYLLDSSRALKPIIYQERKPMEFTAMTDGKDEEVFMNKMYRFGVDGRNNVGFGFWQLAACSKEPLTAANFEKVRTAMRSLKADGGRPLGIRPTILVVPPSLLSVAKAIVEADKVGNNTNPNKGSATIIETEWLID